jgi:hypothetical protein
MSKTSIPRRNIASLMGSGTDYLVGDELLNV